MSERAAAATTENKSVTMVIPEDPSGLSTQLSEGSYLRPIQWMTVGFLVGLDRSGRRVPLLAEEVPSRERGTWVINPDGTMVATWKLRRAATWHDGAPFVARDVVFGWQATVDPEIPSQSRKTASLIASVEAPEEHTVVMHWKGLSPFADALARDELQPLPAHRLEEIYRSNKALFIDGPHWTTEVVGAGPFKVVSWERGVGMTLLAHDGYGPGRPKIDRVNVRFVPDENTIVASVLAGAADLSVSDLSIASGSLLAQQWEDRPRGQAVVFAPSFMRFLEFQQREVPGVQPALRDRTVRKALMYAMDRQAIVDAVEEGRVPVAHFPLALSDPAHPAVYPAAAKYEYDPARAAAAFREAGWERGADGLIRSPAGIVLSVPFQSNAGDARAAAIADDWKRAGVESSLTVLSRVAARDAETAVSFPGVNAKAVVTADNQLLWTSADIPTRANRFSGRNRGGYVNPITDDLAARVQQTLDSKERERLLVDLMRIWTDDVAFGPLFFGAEVLVAGKGLKGYEEQFWPTQRVFTWNIHQWTIG